MARHYQADEFLYNTTSDPMNVVVDKKVSLLYELCILCKSRKDRDARETALREILSKYTTEDALNNALHDIVRGNKSINTFLAQKGIQH